MALTQTDLRASPGEEQQEVVVDQARFDPKARSEGVALREGETVASGAGVAIVNAALHQDQCYFEFTLDELPEGSVFCIGVSQRKPAVTAGGELGDGQNSWGYNTAQSTEPFAPGDVIGCLFDQATGRPKLMLTRNGEPLPPGSEVTGFRGVVHPAVSFAGGCKIRCNFALDADGFKHKPPQGISGLIPSRSLV